MVSTKEINLQRKQQQQETAKKAQEIGKKKETTKQQWDTKQKEIETQYQQEQQQYQTQANELQKQWEQLNYAKQQTIADAQIKNIAKIQQQIQKRLIKAIQRGSARKATVFQKEGAKKIKTQTGKVQNYINEQVQTQAYKDWAKQQWETQIQPQYDILNTQEKTLQQKYTDKLNQAFKDSDYFRALEEEAYLREDINAQNKLIDQKVELTNTPETRKSSRNNNKKSSRYERHRKRKRTNSQNGGTTHRTNAIRSTNTTRKN